jgi:phosphomevalonate kinase
MSDASAPGKLVIAGEYAVLHGAPAIVLAVGVRAHATVLRIEGNDSVLVNSVNGQEFRFSCLKQHGLQWLESTPGEGGRILHAVLDTFLDEKPNYGDLPALRISMKTDAFYKRVGSEFRKLGLGSSAAVLVALVGAIFDALSEPVDIPCISRFCYAAHRRFQDGHGSGVDVAAAINGGVLANRVVQSSVNLSISRLVWPDDLFILPVWSGQSASTVELLSRFNAYSDRNPDAFGRQMQDLTDHAERVHAAWLEHSVNDILTTLDGYQAALRSFDRKAAIGIITDAHEQLRDLVEHHGARYKTSGAGGGDFGFAFTNSREVAVAVRKDFVNAGYFVLDSSIATNGLMIDGCY